MAYSRSLLQHLPVWIEEIYEKTLDKCTTYSGSEYIYIVA